MGMIGNQLTAGVGSIAIANDSFNGNGSTTVFTLSQSVSAVTDIEVLVDNVQQSPYDSSYSVSGTTLTFSDAPAAGTNNIYVIYNHARTITTNQVVPDDGSVVESKLGAAAVTTSKIAAAAVTGTQLHNTLAGAKTFSGLITASAGISIGSGGTTNTLDDYEEGTFTAVRQTFRDNQAAWYGNTGNLTNEAGITSNYTKIGNLVHVYIPRSNVPTNNCSLYRITGLPFTVLAPGNGSGTDRYPAYFEEHRGFGGRYNNGTYSSNIEPFYYAIGGDTTILPGYTIENSDGSLYPFAPTSSGSAFPAVFCTYHTAS